MGTEVVNSCIDPARNIYGPPVKGADVPLCKNEPQAHGTVKTDVYATADGGAQELVTVASPSVKVGPASVSVAVGKDVCKDRPRGDDRSVFDVFADVPVVDHVKIKGRVRTTDAHGNPTSQVRGGIELSAPLTTNDKIYAQAYGARKYTKGGKSESTVGAIAGLEHRVSETTSFYVEGQVYDAEHIRKDNVGVNFGLRVSF